VGWLGLTVVLGKYTKPVYEVPSFIERPNRRSLWKPVFLFLKD